jgi:hypothetical protein
MALRDYHPFTTIHATLSIPHLIFLLVNPVLLQFTILASQLLQRNNISNGFPTVDAWYQPDSSVYPSLSSA